jgi:hypothetical protein
VVDGGEEAKCSSAEAFLAKSIAEDAAEVEAEVEVEDEDEGGWSGWAKTEQGAPHLAQGGTALPTQ